MANFIFYVMAALAVASAVGVVLCQNPVNSVLALLSSFFALATIYLLAGFQFIAGAQILVYAGAILVLFLFVIMLLNLAHEKPRVAFEMALFQRRKSVWTALVAGALFLLTLVAAGAAGASGKSAAVEAPPIGGYDAIEGLAGALFGRYILPFEAVSLLLLATTVAVVVLARRERGSGRRGRDAARAALPADRAGGEGQRAGAIETASERTREVTAVGGGS